MSSDDQRKERLAQALRDNLRRRKAQSRASEQEQSESGAKGDCNKQAD